MAANQVQTGGYECDWVESPPDDVKCQICLTVAKDPLQHSGDKGCGKIFCTSCITKHQKKSQDCPNCREQLTQSLFKDRRSKQYTALATNMLCVVFINVAGNFRWVKYFRYQAFIHGLIFVVCPEHIIIVAYYQDFRWLIFRFGALRKK